MFTRIVIGLKAIEAAGHGLAIEPLKFKGLTEFELDEAKNYIEAFPERADNISTRVDMTTEVKRHARALGAVARYIQKGMQVDEWRTTADKVPVIHAACTVLEKWQGEELPQSALDTIRTASEVLGWKQVFGEKGILGFLTDAEKLTSDFAGRELGKFIHQAAPVLSTREARHAFHQKTRSILSSVGIRYVPPRWNELASADEWNDHRLGIGMIKEAGLERPPICYPL